jgi:hypothetical protein
MKALQKAALLKRVKVYNYIPRNVEGEYARVSSKNSRNLL